MSFTPQNLVYVYYHGSTMKQLMGRLLLKNRQIFFEYDAAFIKLGLALSPFKLPLKAGVSPSTDRTFEGLFGVFNDSLPDGWGRLLLDRKLMRLALNPGSLSTLDRLCFVGSGMGALSYEPENPSSTGSFSQDLDEIEYEIRSTLLYLTRDVRECEIQFRNAVFNVLSHNRDDHSKNFSFLMDQQGTWSVSPAYDLTFSSGPAGEYASMIMGEGKNLRKEHLLKLANVANIKKDKTLEIMNQVVSAVVKWKVFADKAGVSKLQTKNIGDALSRIIKHVTIL